MNNSGNPMADVMNSFSIHFKKKVHAAVIIELSNDLSFDITLWSGSCGNFCFISG